LQAFGGKLRPDAITDISRVFKTVKAQVKDRPAPVAALVAARTKDPFKILVSTILSARTRDEVTARASAQLFEKSPDAASLDALSEEEIRALIRPVGFYNSKARYLAALPEALEAFSGKVPDDIDSLLTLPGVGRKTANLVRSAAFQKPAICVDTHVHRIMNIWGYVQTKTPLQTEMALREKLPKDLWMEVNSTLVVFGQTICASVSPKCGRCDIESLCPKNGVTPRKIKSPKTRPRGVRTLVSWNVNGIRASEKKGFCDIVKELSPDLFAVQETKARPDQLSKALLEIEGYESHWHSAEKKGYSGVAVHCKLKPLDVVHGMGEARFDSEGRVLTLEFDDFYLSNVYFPNAGHGLKRLSYKLDFNRAFSDFALSLAKKKSLVVCGDFNVAHKAIDLANPGSNVKNPGYTPEEREWMDGFTQSGFVDTFRKFNPDPEHYTWWTYRFNARERNIGWRIDYFFVDPQSEARIVGASILKDIHGSDHCPVALDFK
jgi:exodeoxyribonuclease III